MSGTKLAGALGFSAADDLTLHTSRDELHRDLDTILRDRRTYDFQQAIGACIARLAMDTDMLSIIEGTRRRDRDSNPLPWPNWLPTRRGPT